MPCSIMTIIPLFLFVVLSGAVLIYLNFKIIDIKRDVEKQNKVLLSFISDIKINMVNKQGQKSTQSSNGGEVSIPSIASDGALEFVNKIVECDLKCGVPVFAGSEQILLGCNGHSPSEFGMLSSDESGSDDSCSEDDNDVNDDDLIIEVSDVELPISDAVSLPVLVDDIQIVNVEVGSISDTVINQLMTTTDAIEATDATDFGNMKVEQLRKIALEKLLAPTKEVNKMKKNELLALMTRNK